MSYFRSQADCHTGPIFMSQVVGEKEHVSTVTMISAASAINWCTRHDTFCCCILLVWPRGRAQLCLLPTEAVGCICHKSSLELCLFGWPLAVLSEGLLVHLWFTRERSHQCWNRCGCLMDSDPCLEVRIMMFRSVLVSTITLWHHREELGSQSSIDCLAVLLLPDSWSITWARVSELLYHSKMFSFWDSLWILWALHLKSLQYLSVCFLLPIQCEWLEHGQLGKCLQAYSEP